jgi:hypothetical protein
MFFTFADVETLRLALTSGAVAPEVSRESVGAAFTEKQIWVHPSVPMSSPGQIALRRLGVKTFSKAPDTPLQEYACWQQLLPLERESASEALAAQTVVLFELAEASSFTELVSEILRLGNDRQAFRWLQRPTDARERVLLRVIAPPYYSLLRSLDCDGRSDLYAYVERSPGVWVALGYRHPLQDSLRPGEGNFLLLRPPRDWQFVEERPFQDIYEVLEFPVTKAHAWRDSGRTEQLRVPLRLTRASTNEPAELWVVRDRPVEQLDSLVREADDQLLSQLAFAVGESAGHEIVALRVRPGRKQSPPVLVLDAQAYRSYQGLPNLFLPVRTRLRPPLRRDSVRQHLAADPEQIHWLAPGGDGTFVVESLPDRAFRPLSDWILYVLDHERQALSEWIQAATFEFDAFVCREQRSPKEKKEPRKKADRASTMPRKPEIGRPAAQEEKRPAPENVPELSLRTVPPSESQMKARVLEDRFLELTGPPDAPDRQRLWKELAEVYGALGNTADALLCGANCLWPDPDGEKPFAGWADGSPTKWLDTHLPKLLGGPNSNQAELQRLSACLLALGPASVAGSLKAGLGPVQHFLQAHEERLPVRVVWLLGLTLARAAGGDVLALARTRDRLLERLYQDGLKAEQDLPGFLRFSSAASGDRLRRFREWLLTLPERLHRWIVANNNIAGPARPYAYHTDARLTSAYADLMMAFGLGRLGDAQECQRLKERACEVLGDIDNVHSFLLTAFDYRIHQALEGKGVGGALPQDFFELLPLPDGRAESGLDSRLKLDRLKADRLREKSRILEPHKALEAYDRYCTNSKDPLGQELASLADVSDKQELERRIRQLLERAPPDRKVGKTRRPRVLRAALAVAPRLNEAFALEMLGQVEAVLDHLENVGLLADLLDKSLVLSAHFDQSDHVQRFVGRYHQFLKRDQAEIALHGDDLAGQCFRGLRKFGLRDDIEALMRELTQVLTLGQPLDVLRQRQDWPNLLLPLLHVATGWFYFGNDEEALMLLQEARQLLFSQVLHRENASRLTSRYVSTLAQAPVEIALRGIEEILDKLEGVFDNFTTHTHFSLSQLQVVEAIVLGIVTEDFALGGEVRRWLDDDEFLIRRRIHGDLQSFLASAGH